MKIARRFGQTSALALVLCAGPVTAIWMGLLEPAPTATDTLLDAIAPDGPGCISRDDVIARIMAQGLRWSEAAPLDCTDAPPQTAWIAINIEGRVSHLAFGTDGCRIDVAPARCT